MLAEDLRFAAVAVGKPAVGRWAGEFAAAAEQLRAEAQAVGLTVSDLALDYMGVVDRETNGRNIIGDGGHGHGLGQIDDRYHQAWLAAHANGLDPASNILYGMGIYLANLRAVRKSAAAMALPPAEVTVRRVAMAGYNANLHRCIDILVRTGDPDQVDAITTKGPTGHGDYGKDVWRRREEFARHTAPEACPA